MDELNEKRELFVRKISVATNILYGAAESLKQGLPVSCVYGFGYPLKDMLAVLPFKNHPSEVLGKLFQLKPYGIFIVKNDVENSCINLFVSLVGVCWEYRYNYTKTANGYEFDHNFSFDEVVAAA